MTWVSGYKLTIFSPFLKEKHLGNNNFEDVKNNSKDKQFLPRDLVALKALPSGQTLPRGWQVCCALPPAARAPVASAGFAMTLMYCCLALFKK